MKRGLKIFVGAAAIFGAAVPVAACSGDHKPSGPSSSPAAPSSSAVASSAPAVAGQTQVIVGGQPQNVSGPVVCSMTNGRFSIAIGDMLTGVIVGLEQDGSAVHNAGLGTVDGVVMSFTENTPGNDATASKSGNSYRITGNATGVDSAGQQVGKSFEVDVTCP